MPKKFVCEGCGKELDPEATHQLKIALYLYAAGEKQSEHVAFQEVATSGGKFTQTGRDPGAFEQTPFIPVCYNVECAGLAIAKYMKRFEGNL